MQPTFYVTPIGLQKYQTLLQDFANVMIQCEEFSHKEGLDALPCPVCENTNGPNLDHTAIWCFDGAEQRAMCLDPEPLVLRCKPGAAYRPVSSLSTDVPRSYFRATESAASHAGRFKGMVCERYDDKLPKADGKRVWCNWVPRDDDGLLQKNFSGVDSEDPELKKAKAALKATCAAAVPNLSFRTNTKMSLIGRKLGFPFPHCGVDMKLTKCITRLNKEHMATDPWASSYNSKILEWIK
jgi:hypothetical protein